jgi:hypothetical protein
LPDVAGSPRAKARGDPGGICRGTPSRLRGRGGPSARGVIQLERAWLGSTSPFSRSCLCPASVPQVPICWRFEPLSGYSNRCQRLVADGYRRSMNLGCRSTLSHAHEPVTTRRRAGPVVCSEHETCTPPSPRCGPSYRGFRHQWDGQRRRGSGLIRRPLQPSRGPNSRHYVGSQHEV